MASAPNKRAREGHGDQSARKELELRVLLDMVTKSRDHCQTQYAKLAVKYAEGKQQLDHKNSQIDEHKAEVARLKEAEARHIDTKKRLDARIVQELDTSKEALHRLEQNRKQQLDLKNSQIDEHKDEIARLKKAEARHIDTKKRLDARIVQIDEQTAKIARLEENLRLEKVAHEHGGNSARDNLWDAHDKLTHAHLLLENYSTNPTLIPQERMNSLVQDAYGLLNDHLQKYMPS